MGHFLHAVKIHVAVAAVGGRDVELARLGREGGVEVGGGGRVETGVI